MLIENTRKDATPAEIPVRDRYDHFIAGGARPPENGQYLDVENPSTGERLTTVARGSSADVAEAVASAGEGFRAWMGLKPLERGRLMAALSDAILERLEALTRLESLDTGKPVDVARNEILTCARYFEYFGGSADKILGETVPATHDHLVICNREPFGVTAHIIPWNGPATQLGRGIAPALCAGNSVVVKPAEETPMTTFEIARLAMEAGFPPGVINVVNGPGPETGQALVDHDGVRRISFTGSLETGRIVLGRAARRVVPATGELGGKSPFIVFADADLDRAAQLACRAFVLNSGQICSAGTRLLVERSVQDPFAEKLVAELKKVSIGPGIENASIGPVISRRQLERVMGYVDIGTQEGARLVHGGHRPDHCDPAGHYVEPTLFADGTRDMRIVREEIFGPVAVMLPFDGEEEAVDLANDSEFGLAAAVWTSDLGRAHRMSDRIEAGQIYVNDYMPVGVEAPFGGYKNSGFGREKGLAALHEYTQLKTVIVYKG